MLQSEVELVVVVEVFCKIVVRKDPQTIQQQYTVVLCNFGNKFQITAIYHLDAGTISSTRLEKKLELNILLLCGIFSGNNKQQQQNQCNIVSTNEQT